MIRYIPYKGERYRDDRMNVFNIVEGKLEYHQKQKHKIYHGFFVNFYRNVIELPLADSKFFLKKEFAEQCLKINEPCIRLISNYEAPLDILNDDDIWPSWINWLSHKGLHSALSGYQNFQYDVTPEGGSFNIENRYNDYVIDQELLN